MPAKRLPMRQVRDVLRLKHACGMSERLIAEALGVGRTTVGEYLRRASVAELDWVHSHPPRAPPRQPR